MSVVADDRYLKNLLQGQSQLSVSPLKRLKKLDLQKNKSLNEVIDDLKNKESAIYKSIKKIILEFDENGKHVINKAVEALILDYENEITEILED